ncbi:MAG: sugar ABC transporter permease [Actinomycetota bacterium]|nr:sugar ABC transporter permease [Actinomycetota bacterium]
MAIQREHTAPGAAGDQEEGWSRQPALSAGGKHLEGLTPYLFLAPYLLLFTVFVLIPAVYGFWISLHNWDFLLPNKPFVGLGNYTALFTQGSTTGFNFWQSMRATWTFVAYSVPLLLVIPLLVALVLNRSFPGRTAFRAIYFAPYVLGVAVIGILFRFLLDRNVGLVNRVLDVFGVDSIAWLSAVPWVWVSLVGATVWWTLGFNAIIYLAGLQDIGRDQYEAAEVDGANAWNKFWHITIPGLRPVLVLVTTITVLASANMFGQSLLITQGAPGNATRTAIMYIAEEGLGSFRMGNAAAMSYLLMLFLIATSMAIFALFRRWED